MTCSLTEYLDKELKHSLSKDEYCTYENVLNAMYQSTKQDRKGGNLLNEYAFKDFMAFFCVLMIKLFKSSKSKSFSSSMSRSHISRFLKSSTRSKTRKQIGGAKKHISIVYFLLSAYLFYNSYREFGNAITIPDNLLEYVEEHPQSEKLFSKLGRDVLSTHRKSRGFLDFLRPAREILELLHKFITETLSEIAKQDYIKALYDSTYTSGCIRDFKLIFTKKNLGTLIDRVDVLKENEGGILKLYADKYPFQGINMNEDTLDDASKAQSKFNDAMSLFKDTFGIAEYKSSCLVTSILQKEGEAKTKRKQDENELIKKMSKWMSKIKSSANMVKLLFCNIVMSGLILIFILGKEEKTGRSYNTSKNNLAVPKVKNAVSLRRAKSNKNKNVGEVRELHQEPVTGPSYLNQLQSEALNSSLKLGNAIKSRIRGSLKSVKVRVPFTKTHVALIDDLPERPKPVAEIINPVLQEPQPQVERPSIKPNVNILPKEPQTVLRRNINGRLFIYHQGDDQEVSVRDIAVSNHPLLKIIDRDPNNPERVLCRLEGDTLYNIGTYGEYQDTKTGKMYRPPSLSLNGLISYSYYGTYPDGYRYKEPRFVVRYEEDDKRYYIEKGRLIEMYSSYQACPPKPERSLSHRPGSRERDPEWVAYNNWWKEKEGIPQVSSNINLLAEDYHLGIPQGEYFTPIEPGHPLGFMDVRGTIPQQDYIEQKVRSGRWRYDERTRRLVSTGVIYNGIVTMQQERIPLWVEMDRKADARANARQARNREADARSEASARQGNLLFGLSGHTYNPLGFNPSISYRP